MPTFTDNPAAQRPVDTPPRFTVRRDVFSYYVLDTFTGVATDYTVLRHSADYLADVRNLRALRNA